MFRNIIYRLARKFSNFVIDGAGSGMRNEEFLEKEIVRWKSSPKRIMQINGSRYYDGDHDILKRRRTMIGENGELQVVENLPNNRIVNNQYAKMVNQKANYLFGQPFVIETENKQYGDLLKKVFNKQFMRTLKNSGKEVYNSGICWLHPYYDDAGHFSFRLFPGYEILPFWKDNDHTTLDMAVRLYLVTSYKGTTPVITEKVEVYDTEGVHKFIFDHETLIPDRANDGEMDCCHAIGNSENGEVVPVNWQRVPLIPLKANESEMPLLKRVKSLQDGINVMLSDFQNNMQEDARNTILVLKNYDGTNLGEFRKNLATYGVVKVRYDGETKGGVETLEIKVNADNYKSVVEIFKKALIENAMGYDAKDDRLSGNPNQMNIQSMYSDIDIDANDTETEYQAAFENILWFVNAHLANTGQGNFDGEEVNVIFNRDILINESEAIENCQKSVGILSDETVIGQHPWVDDPQKEIERLEKQRQKEQKELDKQYDPFGKKTDDDPVQGGGE